MSSSDSEDDCYGNIALKLKNIKSKIVKEKVVPVVLSDNRSDTTEVAETSEKLSRNVENTPEIVEEDLNTTVNSTDNDEFSLDAIIAKNSKAKPSRGRGRGTKRKAASETFEPSERETRATRRRTSNSSRGRSSSVDTEPSTAPVVPNITTVVPDIAAVTEINDSLEEESLVGSRRGSVRGRGRAARGRRQGRGRGRTRRDLWAMFDQMLDCGLFNSSPFFGSSTSQSSQNYPTYSVGNTDEYPDQSDNQQLFSTRPVSNDVEVIEDEDPLDEDNEELSVKVYWQSLEVFKFKIRKYQTLKQIFDYFSEKEGVSNDKLLLTYNDKILKIDDTPDSIGYSIAKFIDGGIVKQSVTQLAQEHGKENENQGLKIKFQCQNKKKPFETTMRPEDKLALAMMKCAEHLETPLERLKFYFDGDLISRVLGIMLDFIGGLRMKSLGTTELEE